MSDLSSQVPEGNKKGKKDDWTKVGAIAAVVMLALYYYYSHKSATTSAATASAGTPAASSSGGSSSGSTGTSASDMQAIGSALTALGAQQQSALGAIGAQQQAAFGVLAQNQQTTAQNEQSLFTQLTQTLTANQTATTQALMQNQQAQQSQLTGLISGIQQQLSANANTRTMLPQSPTSTPATPPSISAPSTYMGISGTAGAANQQYGGFTYGTFTESGLTEQQLASNLYPTATPANALATLQKYNPGLGNASNASNVLQGNAISIPNSPNAPVLPSQAGH